MNAADYAQSSCRHHIGMKHDAIITDHPQYWALGNTPFEREAAYKQHIEQALTSQQVQAFTVACQKGWPLGSIRFKAELQKLSERRVAPLKRGRPRKEVDAG